MTGKEGGGKTLAVKNANTSVTFQTHSFSQFYGELLILAMICSFYLLSISLFGGYRRVCANPRFILAFIQKLFLFRPRDLNGRNAFTCIYSLNTTYESLRF